MTTKPSALTIDLKVVYAEIQRRFSVPTAVPDWNPLASEIKERFNLPKDFTLGLGYRDEDGDTVVISSSRELAEIWPVVTEEDERDLDALPPLRFTVVKLPSHSVERHESTPTLSEDVPQHGRAKEPEKQPAKSTIREDVNAFIEAVKLTVQDNKDVKEAFDKLARHAHDDLASEEHSTLAVALTTQEEVEKLDALTAGIVSALLTPALMGPPHGPPPHGGPPRPPHRPRSPGPPGPPGPPHHGHDGHGRNGPGGQPPHHPHHPPPPHHYPHHPPPPPHGPPMGFLHHVHSHAPPPPPFFHGFPGFGGKPGHRQAPGYGHLSTGPPPHHGRRGLEGPGRGRHHLRASETESDDWSCSSSDEDVEDRRRPKPPHRRHSSSDRGRGGHRSTPHGHKLRHARGHEHGHDKHHGRRPGSPGPPPHPPHAPPHGRRHGPPGDHHGPPHAGNRRYERD